MPGRRTFLSAMTGMIASGAILPVRAAKAPAAKARTTRAAGARAPVEICDDSLGIPHIRAHSKHDAFFGQGYVVARDRLFQMDINYRTSLGRMAESFGAAFVASDRAARLFLFRGDIDAELAALPAEVLDCVRGYVAGVNARIAEILAQPELAPLEYRILGVTPLTWDVRDLVRIRNPAMGNCDDEVRRAQLHARGLLAFDRFMDPLRPSWSFTVPDELDCDAVGRSDLGELLQIGKPLPFAATSPPEHHADHSRADLASQGSNAWTVAGSRTDTGRPILANDPHLGIGGASPRHVAHLQAPGLDVIGAGFPGLPGIMQGHTERYAFGRTNFHIDQSDLFVLETHPDDPERYSRNGAWHRFDRQEEVIRVRDGADVRVELRYAEGRPVVARDPGRRRAIAFASVALLPGANMQFAIVALNLAGDWTALREAFRLHVSPTNFHYADIDGNIGWHAIGYAPRRPRHDGLFPAPGNGSYDWTGILDVAEMPSVYNPPSGWIASANDMNLPPDYPYRERILSFSWTDSFRHDRIREVLGAQTRHSVRDSIALQRDVQSLPARALVALLPDAPPSAIAPPVELLRNWNCDIGAESAPALLYEMVLQALLRAFRAHVIPHDAKDLIGSINLSEMLHALTNLDPQLGDDPLAVRERLIEEALASGWEQAAALCGPDPGQWRWGALHQLHIAHPLADLPEIAAAFPKIAGGGSGGDGTTVMARGFSVAEDYRVTHGASFEFVADVGAWDRTRFLLLPGQSADPRSPHYADLVGRWLSGTTQPLRYSAAAIERDVVRRKTLVPDG